MAFSTETLLVLRVILPSYFIAFLGYLLGRSTDHNRKLLSDLIYHVFSPCLIFSSLSKRVFNAGEFLALGMSAATLIAVMIPVVWAFKRWAGIPGRGVYLSTVFMSTGSISLPITLLLYGNEGLAKSVEFHLVNVFLLYSLGTWLVSGRAGFLHLLRIPTVPAAGLGILVATAPAMGPAALQGAFGLLLRGVEIVAYGAIPLMILGFGSALAVARPEHFRKGLGGAALRIVGGPLVAFALVALVRWAGWFPVDRAKDVLTFLDYRTTEAVIVLNAAMPGPIMSYMLALKFNAQPEEAAAHLALGAAGGILTVPVVLHLIHQFIF